MALSPHFKPIERGGMKFDAGSILYEFDALREPERTQFPKVRTFLESLGMEFNEVKPLMLWCGNIVPDLYISNQLEAVPLGWHGHGSERRPISPKHEWPDLLFLDLVSKHNHGKEFHDTFIEPMCIKVLGIPTASVIARYHRAAWLPLYWPETLQARASINTRFWYPRNGYAGVVTEISAESGVRVDAGETRNRPSQFDSVEITLTFILAKPTRAFQSLFVVDKSPIYRVTNQDACAGLDAPYHRFVVESREYCQDIGDEMQRLNLLSGIQYSTQLKIRMPIPTLANYQRGWRPAPTLNQQLLEIMDAKTVA